MYVSILYFAPIGCVCSDFDRCFIDLLLSAAPIESHVGAVVVRLRPLTRNTHCSQEGMTWRQDSPNACVTLALPLGIFEHVRLVFCADVTTTLKRPALQDILPKEEGLKRLDFGQCAIRSDRVL